MRHGLAARLFLGSLLIVGLGGCSGVQTRSAEPALAAVPEPPAPVPEPVTVLDPVQERRLVKDLLRDVEAYHGFLQEKRVEAATEFVEPEHRAAFQDDLWDLVARYKIESADVVSYQLFPQSDNTVTASVKVVRTLFQRNSVVPEKSELWMSWQHRGNRWMLRPQKQK